MKLYTWLASWDIEDVIQTGMLDISMKYDKLLEKLFLSEKIIC